MFVRVWVLMFGLCVCVCVCVCVCYSEIIICQKDCIKITLSSIVWNQVDSRCEPPPPSKKTGTLTIQNCLKEQRDCAFLNTSRSWHCNDLVAVVVFVVVVVDYVVIASVGVVASF